MLQVKEPTKKDREKIAGHFLKSEIKPSIGVNCPCYTACTRCVSSK